MRALAKRFRILILVVGVLSLLFSPEVFYFFAMDELDSLHPPAFESADINHSSLLSEQPERISTPISFFVQTLNTSHTASVQVRSSHFCSPSIDPTPMVLRC